MLAKRWGNRSDPFTDLALTLPIVTVYHLGVVFLPVRNAADLVTDNLRSLASYSILAYSALALGISLALVLVCAALAKSHPFRRDRFVRVLVEGALYAVVMRVVASMAVGRLALAQGTSFGPFGAVIMSFGAGFYEEVAFRVGLFGLGGKVLRRIWPERRWLVPLAWAIVTSALFSAWHYLGPEPFRLDTFVFRFTCGVVLTAIYAYRGFATAVFTHALYDVWVLV